MDLSIKQICFIIHSLYFIPILTTRNTITMHHYIVQTDRVLAVCQYKIHNRIKLNHLLWFTESGMQPQRCVVVLCGMQTNLTNLNKHLNILNSKVHLSFPHVISHPTGTDVVECLLTANISTIPSASSSSSSSAAAAAAATAKLLSKNSARKTDSQLIM